MARVVRQDGGMTDERPPRPSRGEILADERDEERSDGITAERRGSPAAPSDRPEKGPPHPQDVNEISDPR